MRRRKIISGRMVREIVRNPVYRGVVRVQTRASVSDLGPLEWDEFKGRHKPLVSPKIWSRANDLLEKSRKPLDT